MTTEVERPTRYFAWHFRLLRFLGLGWWHHPDENNTNNFPGIYMYYSIITQIFMVAGFICLETIDPFVGEKKFDQFMISLAFVVTHNLTCFKIYLFFIKNKEIQEIVRILEIGLYDYYQNNAKNRATVRLSRIITGSFVFFGWMTIVNTDMYGTMQDLRWKAEVAQMNDSSKLPVRTLPQPIYIPWYYQDEKSFVSTFVLETVGLLWTGHIVLTIDTFIGSVILHMSSQFTIMQESIVTAYDRTMSQMSKEASHNANNLDTVVFQGNEQKRNERIVFKIFTANEIELALEETLKDCFRQHQLLISCVEKFAKTYSYGFMTQLISSMAAICVVMVQVSQDASSFKSIRLVTSLAFFAAMIIQLAMQCFTGNELTFQASLVSEAVMQSKWELMPPRLRRMLMMTMVRAQRPIRLTAAGFSYMDNACFVSIMKGAYSYYAVLSQKQV